MRLVLMIALVANVLATNILLPLYVWPASGAWNNVYEAIEMNSQLTFQIIINPNSGPGVNGIFFDEIPNEEDQGDSESVTFLASLVKAARSTFGVHPFKSIFNPGTIPQHTELYDLADYIVVFESEASSYKEAVLSSHIPSGKASKSSILVYNFEREGDKGQLETWLQGMISIGVGSANILNAGYDEATSDDDPAGISTVASILSAGVRSTATPPNGTSCRCHSGGHPGGL
ncbi:hypothetical protein KVR01_007094 [Diaporthe batatas]|uniref:uncharacterized protein n=1 Tax=Diaporthe batatas TaxID=748121 RepID=UPI001D045211|nr:uncharacterized protein KVR01_007094 [Diaporthe batatas]KAG8163797.1 hypothetical protein KVR01_007094 [Diaporthe batatas]